MSEAKYITVYIDGACSGNPGPGGYGIVMEEEGKRLEKSGGFKNTTNNRMEMMAAIVALEALKGKRHVTIFSDSQYLVNAIMQGWALRWKSNGWMRNKKEKALNPDLWDRLLGLCARHQVEFRWLRGHEGHIENERCDQLAREAALKNNLPVDAGYKGG
jgi:ribonuclease HI